MAQQFGLAASAVRSIDLRYLKRWRHDGAGLGAPATRAGWDRLEAFSERNQLSPHGDTAHYLNLQNRLKRLHFARFRHAQP